MMNEPLLFAPDVIFIIWTYVFYGLDVPLKHQQNGLGNCLSFDKKLDSQKETSNYQSPIASFPTDRTSIYLDFRVIQSKYVVFTKEDN
jgi:hypothetical protein